MATDIANLGIKVDSKGVVTATKNLDKLEKQGKKTTKTTSNMGKAFAGAFAVLAVGRLATAAIRNTIAQEKAVAQLEQTLKSTGKFTNELSESLQSYARELQKITTFGDEAIIASEALLLTFTRIGDEVFARTQRSVLDVATAMGTDLKSAAIQVGKALNDPIIGMTALSRSGITFTEVQKDLVKGFVATNQLAKAQDLILTELETQFGGSAEAAKNTLGGAIQSLQNTFGDLLEGDKGSTSAVIQSINDLAETLNSQEVKDGFQAIVSGTLKVIEVVTKGTAALAGFGLAVGKELAIAAGGIDAFDIDRLKAEIIRMQDILDGGNTADRIRFFGKNGVVEYWDDDELEAEIARMQSAIEAAASFGKTPVIDIGAGIDFGAGGGGTADDGFDTTPSDLGDVIRIGNDELTTRNLILERYNELLLESESVAQQVKTPQQSFQEQIELLNELRDTLHRTTGEALISQDQYAAAVEQAQDRLVSATEKSTDAMTEFTIQAARNMESAMADGFFDIMQGEFGNLEQSFKSMIDRMVAELLASQLLDFLKDFATGGGFGDFIGGIAGNIFGGARAEGGSVSAGSTYLVGERGPELITPKQSGTVIPNNILGGGQNITIQQSFTIGEGFSRASQSQVAQAALNGAQRALARNS